MKWMLVVIGIMNGNPEVEKEGLYNEMSQCFEAREIYIWETFASSDGYPPVNFQVVCIPSDKY